MTTKKLPRKKTGYIDRQSATVKKECASILKLLKGYTVEEIKVICYTCVDEVEKISRH